MALQTQFRLKKDVEFKRLRGIGRSWANPLVVLYALPGDQNITRIGISVSSRIGKAVKRNRVKRLIREAARLRHSEISPGWDLLFIARKPIAGASFEQVNAAIEQLLRRAGLLAGKLEQRRPSVDKSAIEKAEGNTIALHNTGSDSDEDSGAKLD
ncbi:MAG: ribonuclease P protein component [Chloroflexi bacterium]|nr:ribonuclease P protein component [Chloroflexota bacterium]